MMKRSLSLTPLFSLLLLTINLCSAEFTGCGGFIKTSATLSGSLSGPLDYSVITVNLFTSEGVLKDSVSCAPNGYYFIPVYDRGSYYLSVEGPQGWTFDTKIHRVQISEETPLCNNDEDLDFFVSGFSLSGWIVGESGPRCQEPVRSDAVIARVDSQEESYGPGGVIVQVTRVGDDTFEPRTTMTGEGGLYVFPKMLPGSYLLTASHPTWSISPQQVTATMADENSKVKESFLVSGYDVRARVISSGGGDPISGVEFTLYNYSSESSSAIKNAGESFSKSRSDDGGRAVFTNIPRGCFLLVPSFADQATFFEFQPTSLQIEVGHGSVVIDNPFKVVGFNMYGRVSHKNGDPIEDVEILVGGEPSARTDADGFYMVEKMTTGTFDIVARKDHISFSELLQYPVTANEPSLPEINAEGYDVCGEVVVPTLPDSISRPKTIKIAVSSKDNYNQKFETSSSTSNSYPFCVHLPLSDLPYTLSPLLPRVLAEAGTMFTNDHHTVDVTNSPVFGLSFSQFLPSLSGHVQCIGSCPASLRVIVSAGGEVVEEVKLSSKGDYLIEKMFPGSYSVRVSELEGSAPWCWEQREKEIVVGRKEASGVDFVQKGFSFGIVSSVTGGSVVAKAKGTKEKESFSITKGKETHCLSKQGRYDFEVEGCYRLSQQSLFLDTSLPIPSNKKGGIPQEGQSAGGFESVNGVPTLIFNPIASLVQGEIEVAGGEKVEVFVKISKAGSSSVLEKVKASSGKTKDGVTTYKYKYWNEKSNRELVLVPEISSSSMLFYPSSATVSLHRELDCNVEVPVFSARHGVFVEGVVNPDMAGISVDILNKKTLERVTTVTTKSGGVYSAGPLEDTVEYEAFVFIDGYHLEKDPKAPHVFFARQLASVKVSVVDSSLNTPIDGVLVSLSGKGYRQNNKTNDEGFIEFLNLSPGAYFLKPMLKEYIFEPRQLSMEIEEGSQHPVSISAVRLEYSCYGRVTSLNNQPLGRVVVEAKSDDDHEETQTDANGNYRLRGMVPGKQYSVSLKNTKSEEDKEKERYEIKNSVPTDVSILAEKKDIRDLNFIAYGQSGLGSLTGTVEVEEAFASSIKLEVFKAAGSALNLVKEVPIRSVKFFEVPNLPLGTYVIKMTSSLPSNQFRFSDVKKTVEFTEGEVVQHVELKMDIMLEDDFTDGTVLPYPFLFVLLFGIYCAFNRQKVSDFMKNPRSLIEEKSSEMSSFIPHHIQNFSKKKQQQGKKGKK